MLNFLYNTYHVHENCTRNEGTKKILPHKHFNKSTNAIIDNSCAARVFASPEIDNGKTSQSSYFYGLSDSNGDETSTGYYVRGESFDKTWFPAGASLARVRAFSVYRGPTRPNFRGTAIMTVIFLHLEERAHFLPARLFLSPSSYFTTILASTSSEMPGASDSS